VSGIAADRGRTQLHRHRRTRAVMSLTRSNTAASMKFVTSD